MALPNDPSLWRFAWRWRSSHRSSHTGRNRCTLWHDGDRRNQLPKSRCRNCIQIDSSGCRAKQWAETILYEFTGGADGQFTGGGLIFDSQGSLYGTNGSSGSSGGGNGTVFQLTPPVAGKTNWVESTIYTFQGGTDGSTPAGAALVQDGSGALYGTTEFGGSSTSCQGHQGCGTVFKLTPPAQGQAAWTESVLYRFTGDADGAMPLTNLVLDSVGNLYGTTNLGGADGEGVMFELSPTGGDQAGWSETVLHSFTGDPDGLWPVGNLIRESNGVLLVSARGGTGGLNGAIVQLTPSTAGEVWREKVIYSFPSNGAGGTNPVGLLLDTSGDIFGATESGGAANFGTVFEVHP